jgi:hypothetical protein
VPVFLTPFIEAFQRTSQVLAGCASLYMRPSCTVFPLFPLDEAKRCLSETGFEQFEPEVYGSLLLFTARKV